MATALCRVQSKSSSAPGSGVGPSAAHDDAVMLCILTCAVAAAAARNTRGARSTKGGQNVRRQRRPSLVAIEHAYNLSKASAGREAIDEAVLFVANEERAGATLGARAANEVARLLRAKQTAPGADEVAPLLRPGREVCAVTKKRCGRTACTCIEATTQ